MSKTSDVILPRLGRFVSTARCAQLPPSVRKKAKACLLYGLAVGIGSVRAPQPRQAALAFDLEAPASGGRATRLLDGSRMDCASAAYCNSVLIHSRVQDDSHPCGHFGGVVIPTALAVAQWADATGADALAAIVAGYEIALRIGRDHAADLSERGFRTTSAYGPFAAAATAARLMKLDENACASALSLAANAASGLREWSDTGTEEGPFQVGTAARNGLLAARLAGAGVIGAPSILTGRAGFFKAFATQAERHAKRVCEGIGSEFELEAVTFKPYPICQFLTGVVQGTIELRRRAGDRPLRAIVIRMHPFEAGFVGVDSTGPFASFQQALMSAPFCSSLAWARKAVSFEAMLQFSDPAVCAIVQRTTVVPDPSLARYCPRVAVTLEDGTLLEWAETQGASAYNLTWDTATRMCAELCAEMGVPAEDARELVAAVDEIEHASTVGRVVQASVVCAQRARRENPAMDA